jgi:hypothetical protein
MIVAYTDWSNAMKLTSSKSEETSKIKVQIKEIYDETIVCKHVMSGYRIVAFKKYDWKLEVGQIVLLEYKRSNSGGGYVVVDDLMTEIDANVLEAHHIIADGMLYTSLIMENPETHQRMHSLVPSSNNLFGDTSIIITGDKIKMKINNGNIFSISN